MAVTLEAILDANPSTAVRSLRSLVEATSTSAKVVTDLRKGQRALEDQLANDLVKSFDRLGAHVASVAQKEGGLLLESESINPLFSIGSDLDSQTSLEEALPKKVQDRIELIIRKSDPEKWAGENLAPILGRYWRLIGNKTTLVLERHDISGPRKDVMIKQLVREGTARVGLIDISEDTKKALFNVVNDAIYEGWDNKKIGRAIRDYVPQGRFVNAGSRYRAEMIARTEMMQAQNRAALNRYKAANTVKGVTAFDGDGDPTCMARNGRHYTIAQAERELGNTHPNCVLVFGPRV
jgi:hypothetical protein